MGEKSETLPEVVGKLFVNRSDCYCLQKVNGSYIKVEASLTDNILHQHLRGELTVGAYQLGKDNTVKYLCFDFDPEHLPDTRLAVQRLLSVLFEKRREDDGVERPRVWPSAVLLEASRWPDESYHVWVLFSLPVHAKVARWLGLRCLELADLNPREVEVFPKQTELTKDRPYGNFVKLPLGKHQAAGKWSRLLNPENFEPLANEVLLDCWGISFSESDIAKILAFKEKESVQVSLKLADVLQSLPSEEEERAAEILARYWRRGYRNRLEMAFLGYCLKKGVSYESARRIIEKVCDLTNDEEKAARLKLVEYHYRNRRGLGAKLAGASLISEVIKEVKT
ncbi:MAG: TOTE conflict system archaeo-eukaryotic primase domain-containing protein [Candidatus Bathyarchaeales archaeon]